MSIFVTKRSSIIGLLDPLLNKLSEVEFLRIHEIVIQVYFTVGEKRGVTGRNVLSCSSRMSVCSKSITVDRISDPMDHYSILCYMHFEPKSALESNKPFIEDRFSGRGGHRSTPI